ncbi:MAG: hypothetical protein JWR62_2376 [Modestobacter sp.]|nr:hypothetical protein [Modestobacter sp.]
MLPAQAASAVVVVIWVDRDEVPADVTASIGEVVAVRRS